MIKRILTYFLIIVIAYLAQAVLFGQAGFLHPKPDAFLIVVAAAAFLGDGREGIVAGLCIGLFRDVLSGGGLGSYAIQGIAAALIAASLNRRLMKDNPLIFMLVVLAATAGTEAAACLLEPLIAGISGGYVPTFAEMIHHLAAYTLPMLWMNALLSLPMFFLLRRILFRRRTAGREVWIR
jgi:rod shape-determining protein MreD